MIKRVKEKKTTTHINYDNDGAVIGKSVVIEDTERTEETMSDYPDGDVIQCQCDSCDEKHCNNPEDCLCDECLVDESCSVKCASGAARDGEIPEGVDFIGCKGGCSCEHTAEPKETEVKMDYATYMSSLADKEQTSGGAPKVKFVKIPEGVSADVLLHMLSRLR